MATRLWNENASCHRYAREIRGCARPYRLLDASLRTYSRHATGTPSSSWGSVTPARLPPIQDRLNHFRRRQHQSRRRRAGATHSRGLAPGSACSRWAMAVSGAFVNTPFTPLRNIVACRSGLALDRV